MNIPRTTEARVLGLMMVLFKQFTITNPVNYPDGKTGFVTYWINADAEQRYNELKSRYDEIQKEKEGKNGEIENDTQG